MDPAGEALEFSGDQTQTEKASYCNYRHTPLIPNS